MPRSRLTLRVAQARLFVFLCDLERLLDHAACECDVTAVVRGAEMEPRGDDVGEHTCMVEARHGYAWRSGIDDFLQPLTKRGLFSYESPAGQWAANSPAAAAYLCRFLAHRRRLFWREPENRERTPAYGAFSIDVLLMLHSNGFSLDQLQHVGFLGDATALPNMLLASATRISQGSLLALVGGRACDVPDCQCLVRALLDDRSFRSELVRRRLRHLLRALIAVCKSTVRHYARTLLDEFAAMFDDEQRRRRRRAAWDRIRRTLLALVQHSGTEPIDDRRTPATSG